MNWASLPPDHLTLYELQQQEPAALRITSIHVRQDARDGKSFGQMAHTSCL